MADYVGGDMIRGHIDTIILNSLIDGDKDTNQIREEIEHRAEGRFQLKQGTFYSALQRISKQGLVNEYRTTGSDGVRRKFFQLTEKGKAHIEHTQSSWTKSREVIDTLIDAPQSESEKQRASVLVADQLPIFEPEEKIIASFAELENSADVVNKSEADILVFGEEEVEPETTIENAVLSEILQSESTENVQNIETKLLDEEVSPTFDEFLDIMARVNADEQLQNERNKAEEELVINQPINVEIQPEIDKNIEDESKNEQVISDNVIAFVSETEEQASDQEIINETFTQTALEETNCAITDIKNETVTKTVEEIQSEPIQEKIDIIAEVKPSNVIEFSSSANEIDDYLDSSDIPLTNDYKEVLNKIFASSLSNKKIDTPATQNVTEEQSVNTEAVSDESYDVYVDELDFSDKEEQRANLENELADHRRVRRFKQTKSTSKSAIDYSDIIALSQEEGFKVTTSDRTNKSELGKILINRLNFHSFLIFYLLIALETLIVGLTMDSVLKFGAEAYIIFASVTLLLPLITGILYYMAPKHTVAEVNSFKSSFETALIITLNLVLITLAVAIFVNLDFSSPQAITRMIFIPILIVINIPLYIVIRYSLLEKQMYFS